MRPVIIVAMVIVGLTWPPEPGPAAMMNNVKRTTFETPTYAAPWEMLKFAIVVSINPER